MKKILKNKLIRTSALLAVLLYPFVSKYQFIYTKGSSMKPTYENGEWILMERKASLGNDWSPRRFDVVVIIDGKNKESMSKRIMGLPGETVEIKNGAIYINGNKINDLFGMGDISPTDEQIIRVPEHYVWLVGDNREYSWCGMLPIDHIRGKIL